MSGQAKIVGRVAQEREDLSRLPRARDFHQSVERLQWLRQNGVAARLALAVQDDAFVAAALLEETNGRWFLWKGPSGDAAQSGVLTALLSAIADLSPVTLVLQPEWVDMAALTRAGYTSGECFATLLVRADGSDADLLSRMKPAARRRVARAVRAGLRFVEDRSAIDRFYPVYASAMHAAASPDFATFAEHASLVALPRVRLFLALRGTEVAAGSICFENQDALEARYVATDAACRHLGPLNFVHFKSLRVADDTGLRFLDLSGLATGESDDKLASINRFKEAFGGVRYDYPVFHRDCVATR